MSLQLILETTETETGSEDADGEHQHPSVKQERGAKRPAGGGVSSKPGHLHEPYEKRGTNGVETLHGRLSGGVFSLWRP